MTKTFLAIFFFFFLAGKITGANTLPLENFTKTGLVVSQLSTDSLLIITKDTTKVSGENKRLIAALLAFPLPFGVLGLHRIYLGTAAWVPVAYVVTLGGFGLLSLIDFIYIIAAPEAEFEALSHNGKLFVWVK